MDRRTAVRNILIAAGGLWLMPSCMRHKGEASIELNDIRISASQEDLLADLVEALIPATDSPGAKELNLHLFVMKMVDDCHSPEEQELFMDGLEKYQKGDKNAKDFWEGEVDSERSKFGEILKKRTIQGYLNSEYVMKNKLKYELVPGRYNGAYKIEEKNG